MNKIAKLIFLFTVFAFSACAAAFCACSAEDAGQSQPEERHIHTFGEWVVTPATCTEDGSRARKCSVCGETEKIVLNATGHEWDESSRTEASCTADGEILFSCANCGQTKTESIAAAGHTWGKIQVTKQPGCTTPGVRSAVCKVCGAHENDQTIPPLGHKFGEWQSLSLPGCTSAGEDERTCGACGTSEKREIPALGHDYDEEFTVDVYPTAESFGQKSRHCKRPGCLSRDSVTVIEKLKAETDFTVSLKTTTGGQLPECLPRIDFYDETGASAGFKYAYTAEITLPTKEYTVTVSGLPYGYSLAKPEYRVTPAEPDLEIRVPASLINEKPPADLRYRLGSVMYDMEVQVVGLNPEDDRTEKLSDIFKNHKAVILNMYFCGCSACVYEMPFFCEAYYTLSPTGKIYGEEVACVMLDYNETVDSVRKFKRCTNYAYTSYPAAYDIPMTMIHEAWLRAYFTRELVNAYPTSLLIDCEGVIVERHVGYMTVSGFTGMMQRGINRYEEIRAWRLKEGLEEEQTAALPVYDIAPPFVAAGKKEW